MTAVAIEPRVGVVIDAEEEALTILGSPPSMARQEIWQGRDPWQRLLAGL